MVWISMRSVHSFLTTFTSDLQRSLFGVPKPFDASIFWYPSVSTPEGQKLPFAWIAALHMSYSLINSDRTGWNFSSGSLINSEAQLKKHSRKSCTPDDILTNGKLEKVYPVLSGLIKNTSWQIVFWCNESIHDPYLLLVNIMLRWCCLFYAAFLIFRQ